MTTIGLFWSKRGEVACTLHAPQRQSAQWADEAWRPIHVTELGRVAYRCQHCDGSPRERAGETRSTPLVLNVDDRPASLYVRDRVLRQHGFLVANADSVRMALDIARQLRPQLILLDVHLPDGDGRELCQRMKQDPEFKGIAIVLISATLAGHTNQLESIRWGAADGFILEPVAPETLASTLRKVLSAAA